MRSQFLFLSVAGLLWLASGSWAQDQQVQEKASAVAPHEASAAVAEVPSGQVVVTYRNGELMIKARNAPLVDVLRAICSQIGAAFDLTSGADEQIFADLGPGRAKKVLASLLEGAPYNYVMAQSAEDENSVMNLIVFPRTKDSKADNQINQPPREIEAQIKEAVELSSDTVSSQNVLQTPTLDPRGHNPPGRLRHRRR